MSTKLKARAVAGVPRTVGQDVPDVSSRSTGIRPRIRRRIPSLPDKHKPPSAKSLQQNGPVNVNGDGQLQDEGACGGQDVRFINVPSARELGGDDAISPGNLKAINAKEILSQSQEHDWNKVYDIDLHACSIGKIDHLENFTKLRVLDLSCNFIQKVDNLHSNPDLRELKLYGNQIKEIEYLDRCKELCNLQLQHNRIKTVGKGLSPLKKLKVLRLDSNYIFRLDANELAGCGQLTYLDISNNRVDNLTALGCLSCLEELYAVSNRLRTVGDITRCRRLQEVDLSYNRLTDISGLKGLPNLKILHLAHNQLSSMKTLGKLKTLQEVNLSNNRVTEVSQFAQWYPSLQILDVSSNSIQKWEQVCTLKTCPELVELYISGNPFCAEDGPKPHYFTELQQEIPNLDFLDGAHTKRPSFRMGTPLMRPMSAASVVSSRQVENQLVSMTDEMANFESSLSQRFESLRSTFSTLPAESPSRPSSSRPVSRASQRSRLQAAKSFAEQNF